MDVPRQGCPHNPESGRASRLRPFSYRSGRHPVPSLHAERASNGRGLFRPGPGKTRHGPPWPLPAPLIPLRLFPAPAHPSGSCFVASATRAYYCASSFPRTVLGSAPCRSRFVAILSFRIFSVRILIFVFRIDRKRIKNFFIVYIPVYIPYIYFFSFCLLFLFFRNDASCFAYHVVKEPALEFLAARVAGDTSASWLVPLVMRLAVPLLVRYERAVIADGIFFAERFQRDGTGGAYLGLGYFRFREGSRLFPVSIRPVFVGRIGSLLRHFVFRFLWGRFSELVDPTFDAVEVRFDCLHIYVQNDCYFPPYAPIPTPGGSWVRSGSFRAMTGETGSGICRPQGGSRFLRYRNAWCRFPSGQSSSSTSRLNQSCRARAPKPCLATASAKQA